MRGQGGSSPTGCRGCDYSSTMECRFCDPIHQPRGAGGGECNLVSHNWPTGYKLPLMREEEVAEDLVAREAGPTPP